MLIGLIQNTFTEIFSCRQKTHTDTKNERAKELFKNKDWLNIDLILFDEAQLSDEHSVRGLYFDSIVRRTLKYFPDAKFVFAHPFVENPEAQLQKNGIEIIDTTATYSNYELKM